MKMIIRSVFIIRHKYHLNNLIIYERVAIKMDSILDFSVVDYRDGARQLKALDSDYHLHINELTLLIISFAKHLQMIFFWVICAF